MAALALAPAWAKALASAADMPLVPARLSEEAQALKVSTTIKAMDTKIFRNMVFSLESVIDFGFGLER
jgi:hypothetical protein